MNYLPYKGRSLRPIRLFILCLGMILLYKTAFTSQAAAGIDTCSVKLSEKVYTYNGTARKPRVTVKDGKTVLKEGIAYQIRYINSKKAGTAKVTVTGLGEYTGSKTVKYKIYPRNITPSIYKVSDDTITIKWDLKPEADGYHIYRKNIVTGKKTRVGTVAGDKKSFKVKNLTPGTPYRFSVRAYAGEGDNILKSQKEIPVTGTTTMPRVTGFTVTDNTYEALYLSWDKVKGASGYMIYRFDAKAGRYVKLKTIRGNTGSCVVHDLKGSTTYRLMIKAYKTVDGRTTYSTSCPVRTGVTAKDMSNKTLYVDGDSIAFGSGAHEYAYGEALQRKYGFKLIKKAMPGALLASAYPHEGTEYNGNYYPFKDHIVTSVLQNVRQAYDYAIIDGGFNDYHRAVALGSVSDASDGVYDRKTTCGALESIFFHFRNRYPKTKLYYVLPHKIYASWGYVVEVPNSIGLTFKDYTDSIRVICRKYNVKIIDVAAQFPYDLSDKELRERLIAVDGIHPRKAMQINYYAVYCAEAMGLR